MPSVHSVLYATSGWMDWLVCEWTCRRSPQMAWHSTFSVISSVRCFPVVFVVFCAYRLQCVTITTGNSIFLDFFSVAAKSPRMFVRISLKWRITCNWSLKADIHFFHISLNLQVVVCLAEVCRENLAIRVIKYSAYCTSTTISAVNVSWYLSASAVCYNYFLFGHVLQKRTWHFCIQFFYKLNVLSFARPTIPKHTSQEFRLRVRHRWFVRRLRQSHFHQSWCYWNCCLLLPVSAHSFEVHSL